MARKEPFAGRGGEGEGTCVLRVSLEELEYLTRTFSGDEGILNALTSVGMTHGRTLCVDLSTTSVTLLDDMLATRLARVGFDKDYELTEEGRVLEDLIDRCFEARCGPQK